MWPFYSPVRQFIFIDRDEDLESRICVRVTLKGRQLCYSLLLCGHAARLTRGKPSTECLSALVPVAHQRDNNQCDAFRYFRRLTQHTLHDPRRGLSTSMIECYIRLRGTQTATSVTIYTSMCMCTAILGIRYSLIHHEQNWLILCIADEFHFSPVSRWTLNITGILGWITAHVHRECLSWFLFATQF
jgi:hypothetical protein